MTAPTVTLRDLTPDDSDRLLAWRNSEAVRPYMYSDHLISPEEHARWFAGIAGDPSGSLLQIHLLPGGRLGKPECDACRGWPKWVHDADWQRMHGADWQRM